MRGRAQVLWLFAAEVRANAARDFLNGQLLGRSYIPEDVPRSFLLDGQWSVRADVALDTVVEGVVVKDLFLTRQASDTFILEGSWTQFHHCDHYDDANNCASTVTRTVK